VRRQWILALVALAIGAIYFVSAAGIVSTNDGSHYALTRAIVDTGSVSIDPYIRYTARNDLGEIPPSEAYLDLSYHNGHFYSDRGPGTAFLAAPFYLVGKTLQRAGLGGQDLAVSSVVALAALAGVALFLAAYGLGRELGARFSAALATALLLAFGTLAWEYSTALFSHVVSAALLTAAAFAVVRWSRSPRSGGAHWLLAGAGLALGYGVLVEYDTLVVLAPFVLYLLLRRAGWRDWLGAIAGAIPPLAVLGLYDWLNFGSPLTTSYAYQFHFVHARSFLSTFAMPILDGLRFYVTGPNGLFAVSPFLALSLVGLILLARARWREAVLLFGTFAVLLFLISTHRTTEDTRYLLTVVPLLATPLAFLIESVLAGERRFIAAVLWLALAVLGGFSVLRSYLSLQVMWGHFAAERDWTKALELVLGNVSASLPHPRWPELAIYFGLAVVSGAVLCALALLLPRLRRIGRLRAGLGAIVAVIVLGGFPLSLNAAASNDFQTNEEALLAAGSGLLANPGFELGGSSGSLAGWQPNGATSLVGEGHKSAHSARLGPDQADLTTALIYVTGGKQHSVSWYAKGTGTFAVDFLWENDQRQQVGADSAGYRGEANWAMNHLTFVAPIDATGLRVRFRLASGTVSIDDVRLAQVGVRVEPLADYGKAALAFTFDWETAMGGAIHSKGAAEPDVPSATTEGLQMRQGAENLLNIFQRYNVRGTFYATGYNLLDGNPQHQTFAGDPTYAWANQKDGWASDFWTTHPWYGFDPFGTDQTDPAWYFGDLVDRMASAGQDIQSHTFGHLYVRGTTPEELKTDLAEWNRVAAEKHLFAARTFAFPWRSSNSVKLPQYQVLADDGIAALTRLYEYENEFELGSIPTTPALLTYPDRQFVSTVDGENLARQTIDEVMARRGFTSLWTHPEEVTTPGAVEMWRGVVEYAAAKRVDGLVVDSLTNIVDHYLAARQVKVEFEQSGKDLSLTAKNTGETSIDGVTLTMPGLVKSASLRGGQSLEFRRDQVVLPTLQTGSGLEIVVTLQ
jgi:peptidoglycan/xylan/chitin deacetylase (PgdA/CDA1 family)